jgi:hypothetical protein
MSAKPNVRSTTACKIVSLDVLKLNEAVSRKDYRCAPKTTAGSPRIFDQQAMLPLYFFARLIDYGLPVAWAGPIACDIADHCKDSDDNIVMLLGERNPIAFGGNHPAAVEWMSETEYDKKHKNKGLRYEQTIAREVVRLVFNVRNVRAIIAEMLQHEVDQFLAGKSGDL